MNGPEHSGPFLFPLQAAMLMIRQHGDASLR
jgi:hypothetical protein